MSSSLLLGLVGPHDFGFQDFPIPSAVPSAVHRAGDVAAPIDIVRHAAVAGDGDVVFAVVAPVVAVVDVEYVAVRAVVPDVAVPAVRSVVPVGAVPAVPAGGACGVSMTHKARVGCWVQQVSRVLKVVVEVVAAVVAGIETA